MVLLQEFLQKESGPLLKWDVIYASVFLEVRKKRRQHQILELDQPVYFNDPTVGKVPLSLSHPIVLVMYGHLMTPEGVFHGSKKEGRNSDCRIPTDPQTLLVSGCCGSGRQSRTESSWTLPSTGK